MLGMVDCDKHKVYEDILNELKPIVRKDEILCEAFSNWKKFSEILEEQLAYEARLKQVLDDEAAIRESELRLKEGV